MPTVTAARLSARRCSELAAVKGSTSMFEFAGLQIDGSSRLDFTADNQSDTLCHLASK